MSAVLYAILSVVVVSLVSLIGAASFFIKLAESHRFLLVMVSLSAGTLFGGAFLHLLPEAVDRLGFGLQVSLLLLAGVLVFFILDKFIHWRHCHHHVSRHHGSEKDHEHIFPPQIALLNIAGDAVHNFLDGLVIAGSYLVSIPTGIATTAAVIFHEVPQEMADFGVLLYSGWSKKKALLLNFLSGAVAIAGVVIGLVFASKSDMFISIILPFAAGGFVYIAGSNLIPELHKTCDMKDSYWHFLALIAGIGLMIGLRFLG